MKEPNIDEHMSRYDARMREAKIRIAAAERRAAIRKLAIDSLMDAEFRNINLSKEDILARAIHKATVIYDDVMAFDIPDKV